MQSVVAHTPSSRAQSAVVSQEIRFKSLNNSSGQRRTTWFYGFEIRLDRPRNASVMLLLTDTEPAVDASLPSESADDVDAAEPVDPSREVLEGFVSSTKLAAPPRPMWYIGATLSRRLTISSSKRNMLGSSTAGVNLLPAPPRPVKTGRFAGLGMGEMREAGPVALGPAVTSEAL
jgi:hypothetical protein